MMTAWGKIKMQSGVGKIEKINIFRLLGNSERVFKAGMSHAQGHSASDGH